MEWTNLFGPRNKVVYLNKLVFQSGIRFLIRCIFVVQTTFHLEDCSKNGQNFRRLTFKDIQLCCLAQNDSFTLKVLKSQFVTVKHDSASISNVECATYHIEAEPCLTETRCDFRTFRVKESFWAKQQSCITLKVSLRKWCPFFDFVCFSGHHFA